VIYNADFDRKFVDLADAAEVQCAMLEFADYVGDWSDYWGNNRWQSLATAARVSGHEWTGAAHGALADALACRHVWQAMPRLYAERVARNEAYEREAATRRLEREIEDAWMVVDGLRYPKDAESRPGSAMARLALLKSRAEANAIGTRRRRHVRLCQAIKAFEPLLRQMGPTAEDILSGRIEPTACVSRSTIIGLAKEMGIWQVEHRAGTRHVKDGWWDMTADLAAAIANKARTTARLPYPPIR
jgi:hypothetical protein